MFAAYKNIKRKYSNMALRYRYRIKEILSGRTDRRKVSKIIYAEKLGITYQTWWNKINATTETVGFDFVGQDLLIIANGLGVKVGDLYPVFDKE
jgi:hypothetical protein